MALQIFKRIWPVVIGLFLILGIGLYAVPGFSFSSYLCFGCAALVLCYRLLAGLQKHNPKFAKLLRRILTVLLCIGLVCAGITGIVIASAATGTPEADCDYLIVLGAGVNGTQPSLILSNRLHAALAYLQTHPQTICIVSGGQGSGEDISEADCMGDWLIEKGMDAQRIWREDQSTSTRENLQFSLSLIEEKTGARPTRAGILSNEFHLFRAGMEARSQGLEPVGIPAKTSWLSLRINYFLREIPAVWYYALFG